MKVITIEEHVLYPYWAAAFSLDSGLPYTPSASRRPGHRDTVLTGTTLNKTDRTYMSSCVVQVV